jgi:site-specific DNA recombinase
VRGETVTQIALWRYHEGLGYDTIADRLNADPAKYPPPVPPGDQRARGAWGKTSVYEVLLRNRLDTRSTWEALQGKASGSIFWTREPIPAGRSYPRASRLAKIARVVSESLAMII